LHDNYYRFLPIPIFQITNWNIFFDVHVTLIYDKFIIIKPTRGNNFSDLFLEWNSTYFGQFLCPSSAVFHCTHSNDVYHTCLLTACKQDQDGTSWSCLHDVCKFVRNKAFLCVQWKTPDDGQRICPKHVEFHSKNKFKRLVHLVILLLRHCATSRKVVSSIPDGAIGIFHWHNPSGRTMNLGLNHSLTEMSTRSISWE
jgi:hypothetical protein